MIWNKKHIIQNITYGSKHENNVTTTYHIIEKRYIPASEIRKTPNGKQLLTQYGYKLRGRARRMFKMILLKYGIEMV